MVDRPKITEYSSVSTENEKVGTIGITGADPVSNIDDALQTMMAHLADMNAGTAPLDDTFTIASTDPLKGRFRFDASQVGNSTTQVLTVPNVSGSLVVSDENGVIPAALLPDVISASADAALNEKVVKTGDIMTGALSAPQIISTAAKTDVVDGNTNGVIKDQNQYWGVRQSTANDFCVDVFNGGAPLNALKITQDGYVLKPNQPIASVSGAAIGTVGLRIYKTIFLNQGGHYDKDTGRFNCPADGVYFVTAFDMKSTTGEAGSVAMSVSRGGISVSTQVSAAGYNYASAGAYASASVSVAVHASAGDYLEIAANSSTAGGVHSAAHGGATFMLIG